MQVSRCGAAESKCSRDGGVSPLYRCALAASPVNLHATCRSRQDLEQDYYKEWAETTKMTEEEKQRPVTALTLLTFLPTWFKFYVVSLCAAMHLALLHLSRACIYACLLSHLIILSHLLPEQVPGPIRFLWFFIWTAMKKGGYQLRKKAVIAGKSAGKPPQSKLCTVTTWPNA